MPYTLLINKEKLRNFLYENKSILINGILHLDYIPNKKLINATKIYEVDNAHVIALYDTTFLKSGKDGLLICDNFIGIKHTFCSADKISYEDLIIGGIDCEKKIILTNNKSLHLSKDEFIKFFMMLKTFLISEEKTLKNIYENYVNNKLNDIKSKIKENIYTNLEHDFLILNKVIIKQYNIKTDTMLYYLGCLIFLEKFNFQEVDKYFLKLKELNQLNEDIMTKLKENIKIRKLQYQFNLLADKKNKLIENHEYDQAVIVVNKQKLLNIKPIKELEREISRIKTLKEDYIVSLEKRVQETLLNREFDETFNILNTLKEINPKKSYTKEYIITQIESLDFLGAMINIQSIPKSNYDLANELKNKLQIKKEKSSKTIKEAIESKNYSFFKENNNLKYLKDKWGISPLMHFVIKEDLDGIKLLKDTFDINDINIVGHTTLNLVALSESYKFKSEAFRILDNDLDKMFKMLKTKSTIGKFKKLALNGGELLNNNAIIRYDIEEATASYEQSINKSIKDIEQEIHSYLDNLIYENEKQFKRLIINSKNYIDEIDNLKKLKNDIIDCIKSIENRKEDVKNSLENRVNEAVNENLNEYIMEAVTLEIGEKNEFEKTTDYEKRKNFKIDDITKTYKENNYIKEKIAALKIQITEEIDEDVKKLEYTLKNKNEELIKLKNKIKEYSFLVDSGVTINIDDIFNYYYEKYKKTINIGVYNADLEVFNAKVNNEEVKIPVPLSIAKEFKENFTILNTKYEKIVSQENEKYTVEHFFVYEFKGKRVKIPFLKS